jgi:uncharacterized protein
MLKLSRYLRDAARICWLLPAILSAPALAQDAQISEAPAEVIAEDQKPVAAPAPVIPIDADPALWVVKDDDTTIYLFGTVHILKPGLTWFDEAVKQAFDKSDTLVMEIIEPSDAQAQREIEAFAIDRKGKALRGRLNAEQQKIYDAAMTKLKFPTDAFDPLKPWYGSVVIEMSDLMARGYDLESGVEVDLTKAATAAKKRILGLETFSGQLQIFDSVSEKSQIELLMTSAKSVSEQSGEMEKLVDLWAKPDPDGLAKVMNEGLPEGELRTALLTKRNANWAAWINRRLAKPGTIFVAVGAGHLSGEDSVQAMLKTYKVETQRVEY